MTENDQAWAARYALARRIQLSLLGITPPVAELDGEAFTSTLFDDLPVQREPFQDALYRVAQAAGPSSTDIDVLLDAHRQAYGDPEQVAYARQVDPCDERLVPVEREAQVDEAVRDYLEEHARWRGR